MGCAHNKHESLSEEITIRIFERVSVIPNSFTLNARASEGVIRFDGEDGIILINANREYPGSEFSEYIDRVEGKEYGKCGVSIIEASHNDLTIWVVYEESEYIVFVGVERDVVDKFIDIGCRVISKD
jgi:hypothetical protein